MEAITTFGKCSLVFEKLLNTTACQEMSPKILTAEKEWANSSKNNSSLLQHHRLGELNLTQTSWLSPSCSLEAIQKAAQCFMLLVNTAHPSQARYRMQWIAQSDWVDKGNFKRLCCMAIELSGDSFLPPLFRRVFAASLLSK